MPDDVAGGEGAAQFDEDVLERLRSATNVVLRLTRPDGSTSSRPIWVVVEAGVPYIRSAGGANGVWYRRLQEGADATLILPELEVPFDAEHVDHPQLTDRVSQAYRDKYQARLPGPARRMVSEATVGTTLRLRPRST